MLGSECTVLSISCVSRLQHQIVGRNLRKCLCYCCSFDACSCSCFIAASSQIYRRDCHSQYCMCVCVMKVTVWSLCEVANMCTMHEKGRVMGRHELLIPSLGRIPLGDRGHVGHYAIIAGLLGTSISHITHFHTLTQPISNQFSPMYLLTHLRTFFMRMCTPTHMHPRTHTHSHPHSPYTHTSACCTVHTYPPFTLQFRHLCTTHPQMLWLSLAVYVPAGNYLISSKVPISIPKAVSLVGTYR